MSDHDPRDPRDPRDPHDPLAGLLRRADPARRPAPAAAPLDLDRLLEDTVTLDQQTPAPVPAPVPAPGAAPRRPARRTRLVGAAAAAVVLLGAGGVVAAVLGDDPANPGPATAEVEVLELALPQDAALQSCAVLAPEVLRGIPVAFDGTVTAVADDQVTLRVDRWYAGGDADVVTVTSSDPALVPLLGGVVDFEDGGRYLVSASQGQVSVCGFSGPWSPELERVFEAAYAR